MQGQPNLLCCVGHKAPQSGEPDVCGYSDACFRNILQLISIRDAAAGGQFPAVLYHHPCSVGDVHAGGHVFGLQHLHYSTVVGRACSRSSFVLAAIGFCVDLRQLSSLGSHLLRQRRPVLAQVEIAYRMSVMSVFPQTDEFHSGCGHRLTVVRNGRQVPVRVLYPPALEGPRAVGAVHGLIRFGNLCGFGLTAEGNGGSPGEFICQGSLIRFVVIILCKVRASRCRSKGIPCR